MAADGFVSVSHPDAGLGTTFLRSGLPSFRPVALAGHPPAGDVVG